MGGDEVIDAAHVGIDIGAVVGGDLGVERFGDAAGSELAGASIEFEGGGTDDLGEITGGAAAKAVHLPEPFGGGDVALGEPCVFLGGGLDVGSAEGIADDGDAGTHGSGEFAGDLGQGTPEEPPHAGEERDACNRNEKIDDTKDQARQHHRIVAAVTLP